MSNINYPKLGDLLPLEKIPSSLEGVKDWLDTTILNEIYIKDLVVSQSYDGTYGSYSFTIIYPESGIEIPFVEGLLVTLNANESNLTEIPVAFEYYWPIIKYFDDFNADDNLGTAIQKVFNILIDVFQISPAELLEEFINTTSDDVEDAVDDFIQTLKANNNLTDTFDGTTIDNTRSLEYKVDEIINYIEENDLDVFFVIFQGLVGRADNGTISDFINLTQESLSNLLNDLKSSIEELFAKYFANYDEVLLDLITPKYTLEIDEVKPGLLFSRDWLIPVDNEGNPEPDKHSVLDLNLGSLSFSQENGFDFDLNDFDFSLSKSLLANTGLIVEFNGLKVDLSNDTNMPEANADGRPVSFKGVYVEDATISLPDSWSPEVGNIEITSKNLLIGSEGGVSGTIGIKGSYSEDTEEFWSQLKISSVASFSYDEILAKLNIIGETYIITEVADEDNEGEFISVISIDTDGHDSYEWDGIGELYVRDIDQAVFKITFTEGNLVVEEDGVIAPTSDNLIFNVGDESTITISEFSISFKQNEIVASSIKGSLAAPFLNGATLDVEIDFANGFLVKVFLPEDAPFQLYNGDAASVTLRGFEIGKLKDIWKVGIYDTVITNNDVNIPLIGKYLPLEIDIKKLIYDTSPNLDHEIEFTWPERKANTKDKKGNFYFPLNIEFGDWGGLKGIQFAGLKLPELNELDGFDGFDFSLEFFEAVLNFNEVLVIRLDGFGYNMELSLPEGNLFDVNWDLTLQEPKGMGIEINAGAVKGSGYLYRSEDEYYGSLELEILDKFTVTAVGVLNQVLPDGSEGNSLLAIMGATGLNIQLGMGFVLDGIGGVLGTHRTMNTDLIRRGLDQGNMENILFPTNIVSNIDNIISDIKSIFPIKKDQFLFGPMARLSWGGSKSLVNLDLGLLVEFPSPDRIALLGKMSVLVGSESANILNLNVGFLADLDFDNRRFSFDASLYDSKLLAFPLEGDMAIRLFWGNEKAFLFSAGGFHPEFQPDEFLNVGNMKRLTINLLQGNPRLTITSYFALTSNTFQFGAAADFQYKISAFKLKGGFGFDCLFQFNPFRFAIDMRAYLTVYWGSSVFMSITLNGGLSGPTPWKFRGKASFRVSWLIKISVNVNKTWGEENDTSLNGVDVFPLVLEDLEKNDNWEAIIPDNRFLLVTQKDDIALENDLVLHPMGVLSVRQNIVPLEEEIEKYGTPNIIGENTFTLDSLNIGGTQVDDLESLKESYAPSQYFDMNDDDKLKSSSYTSYKSGVRSKVDDLLETNFMRAVDVAYDITMKDGPLDEDQVVSFDDNVFKAEEFYNGGSIGRNSLSKKNKRNKLIDNRLFKMDSDRFVIINNDSMGPYEELVEGEMEVYKSDSLSSALAKLRSLGENEAKNYTVVPEYELEVTA